MVIVIHQSNNTRNAFLYNEKKVNEGVASYFHSANTVSVNPFLYDQRHRWKILHDIEKENPRVKKKCLHISVNPSSSDILKLDDTTIRQEVDRMMDHMGYGNQPYFVYKHQDLERIHFHVVSTRIDRATGKKIRDSYEKDKMQKFVKYLEQKYQLKQEVPKELVNLKFTASSENLKQNLENLFKQLNSMEFITSKEMYDQALGLFQVEIRKSGSGHLVFVTDENGNLVRYPVKMSDFSEKPQFYFDHTRRFKNDKRYEIKHPLQIEQLNWEMTKFKNLFIRELIRQVYYSRRDTNQRLLKKKDLRKKKRKRY